MIIGEGYVRDFVQIFLKKILCPKPHRFEIFRDHSVFMVGRGLEIHQRAYEQNLGPVYRIGQKCCCPLWDWSQKKFMPHMVKCYAEGTMEVP